MTESATFVLPDLIEHCPFKLQINSHHKIAKIAADDWLKSYGIVNAEKVNKWQFHMFAAMTHSTVDVQRLCVLVHYYQWLFLYDDFFDDGMWSNNLAEAKRAAGLTIDVLQNPETYEKTSFASAEMLRSIVLNVKRTATEECQRRLVEHTQQYINAAVQQVLNRTENIDLNIDTYIEIRRQAAALPSTFDMIEYALDLEIPDEVMNNSTIQKLLLYCNDIVAWINDLYSFNVEQSWGEIHNLVIVAMASEGRSLQESIDFVGDLIKERFDSYITEKDTIPFWNSKINQDIATYFTAIEQWIIGYIHWSFITERYFGTAREQVKRTRVVTLLPQKQK